MIKRLGSLTSRYIAIAALTFLLYHISAFAQKTLPLDNSTCNPQNQVNCLWNDHLGCFIRAAQFVNNGTCAPVDASGRAGVQVVSPDGNQITTTRCAKSVTVNDLCDTILTPAPPFETVTVNLNPTPTPTPPPPPTCTPTGGTSGFKTNQTGGGTDDTDCSPIIIDTAGEGFHLTSAANGVSFDIRGIGHPVQIAWTDAAYRNGFLALDRNHNGTIDDGTELFGNFTQQPKSPTRNGFLALAEFDKPENGGNGDGTIDQRDAVFSHLVVWIDENHDGISQPNEIHTLAELGIFSISLSYTESRRTDEFGNVFRFRAKTNPSDQNNSSEATRWVYDVFLVTQ